MPNQSPKIPLLLLSEAARICRFSIRMSEGWPAMLPAYDLAQLMAGATPRERKDAFETWAAVIQYSIDNKSLATIKIRKDRPQVAVIGRIGPASGEFRPPPEPVYYDLLHVTREATAAWLADIRETPSELVAAWLLSGGITLPTAADRKHAEGPTVDTTRLVRWQAATLDNWRQITAMYGSRPAAREVMRWLRDNGPRNVFPAPGKDEPIQTDSLIWMDTYGSQHTLTVKHLGNVISEWRKAGKIPA